MTQSLGPCNSKSLPGDSQVKLPSEFNHLKQTRTINHQQAIELERNSRRQIRSRLWHQERKLRLTASQFGLIMKRKATPSNVFLDSLFKQRAIHAASVKYGQANERRARQQYCKIQAVHTHDCGLVVNPEFPFLGATPDATVCQGPEFGLLEIKCPYSAREMTIDEAVAQRKISWLSWSHETGWTICRESSYHYQIQGQLLISGAPWCDLAIYTKKDFKSVRVYADVSLMEDMLKHLSSFYHVFCLPYITANF